MRLDRAAIEIAGRLVGEQDLRPIDDRTGNHDPLAFTGGELAGKERGLVEKIDATERGPHAPSQVPRPHPPHVERHGDVVEDAAPFEQLPILEHDAEMPPVHRQMTAFQRRDVDTVDEYSAAGRCIQPQHQVEKRTLARPRVSGQEH